MDPKKGYYSLVQFCPDRSRMESVNIGIVLLVPESQFIGARMATSHQRVRGLWGRDVDLEWLRLVEQSIKGRIGLSQPSLAELEKFSRYVETRANETLLTKPRPVKVLNPDEELGKLFHELVEHRVPKRARELVIPELDKAFRQPHLSSRIKFDQEVEVPIVGRMMRIPYAYQNGKMHFIKPAKVSPDLHSIESLVTEGNLLQRRHVPECKVIIVPELPPERTDRHQETRAKVSDLLKEYELRAVWEEQRQDLVSEVEQSAH